MGIVTVVWLDFFFYLYEKRDEILIYLLDQTDHQPEKTTSQKSREPAKHILEHITGGPHVPGIILQYLDRVVVYGV